MSGIVALAAAAKVARRARKSGAELEAAVAAIKAEPKPQPKVVRGPMGPMPKHEWNRSRTRVRFESAPGEWGDWSADLRGASGISTVTSVALGSSEGQQQVFILADANDPTPSPGYPAIVFRPTGVAGQYTMEIVQ